MVLIKHHFTFVLYFVFLHITQSHFSQWRTNCSDLHPGQYLCLDLNIDPNTQQPKDCDPKTQRANVTCVAAPGINCTETGNSSFTKGFPCKYTNGYSFETALLLSVFLGMFGIDR
ncbi:UNVERIFIED_CONTAM: hypothetical protein GTU68_034271, partial [Idotea baltica]|nr:hypothetical protein [Idotea baltica]